ncbi:MAG: helix-turn-helix domain-containing protein [Allorhizobium sp.]
MRHSIQVPSPQAPNNWAGTSWSFRHQQFGDVTEQAGMVSGWQIACSQLGRGRYAAHSETLSIGRITIARDRINLPIGQESVSPTGRVSIIFPLRSEGGWRVDGHRETDAVVAMRQGQTHLLVAPGSSSELLHVEFPSRLLGPDIDPAVIQSRRLRTEDGFLRDWLLCLLSQARAGIVHGNLATAALEEILLIRLSACARAFAPAPSEVVVRTAAIDLLAELERSLGKDDDIPDTLGALCTHKSLAFGELASATHAAFGQAPDRWYRMARLNGVHRELKARAPGLTVTRAATRWGFYHLGRFSSDYAAFFGQHPCQTLRPS